MPAHIAGLAFLPQPSLQAQVRSSSLSLTSMAVGSRGQLAISRDGVTRQASHWQPPARSLLQCQQLSLPPTLCARRGPSRSSGGRRSHRSTSHGGRNTSRLHLTRLRGNLAAGQ